VSICSASGCVGGERPRNESGVLVSRRVRAAGNRIQPAIAFIHRAAGQRTTASATTRLPDVRRYEDDKRPCGRR
jgi:hypothetical protein